VSPGAFEAEVRVSEQADVDALVDALRNSGVSVWRLARREQTLEEVFMDLVGAAAK
jgi:predicted nucleotidyltransferase